MIEFRKIVEPEMAALSAIRSGPEDIELLQKELDAMSNSERDRESFLKHDHFFHLQIAHGTKNQVLIEVMLGIQGMLEKTQAHIIRKSMTISHRSLDFHRKILDSIKKSKPKLAQKHMCAHIIDIEKEMYKILKQGNSEKKNEI
jgi:GntR family transcriptional repressor for pyruvate dehydrogenase complex